MLLQHKTTLTRHQSISSRRAANVKVEKDKQTDLSWIDSYLKIKYGMSEDPTGKSLGEAQKESVYNEINKKKLDEKLYRAKGKPIISLEDCSRWLKDGDEASLCNLQDRNKFLGAISKCEHCKNAAKTVDHLASKCDRMLSDDYTRRHNEVVRWDHVDRSRHNQPGPCSIRGTGGDQKI